MAERDYDQMSASEVIADLHGEGYKHPDTGEVWDGEEFVLPDSPAVVVNDSITSAVARDAKQRAKRDYLKTHKSKVETRMRELEEARERLDTAIKDLEDAERNAERWYGS